MIQQIRTDIGPVRPLEAPEIRLYADFEKLDRIVPDGFKERPFQVRSQIHDLLAPISENQLHPEVFQGSHALDAGIDRHPSAILLEGIDRVQGLMPLGKLPVRPKFIAMEIRPFEDKNLRSPRKISFDQSERLNRKRGGEFRVLGMEMGRSMVAVEHPDDDSEELADPRHGLILGSSTRGAMVSRRFCYWSDSFSQPAEDALEKWWAVVDTYRTSVIQSMMGGISENKEPWK